MSWFDALKRSPGMPGGAKGPKVPSGGGLRDLPPVPPAYRPLLVHADELPTAPPAERPADASADASLADVVRELRLLRHAVVLLTDLYVHAHQAAAKQVAAEQAAHAPPDVPLLGDADPSTGPSDALLRAAEEARDALLANGQPADEDAILRWLGENAPDVLKPEVVR